MAVGVSRVTSHASRFYLTAKIGFKEAKMVKLTHAYLQGLFSIDAKGCPERKKWMSFCWEEDGSRLQVAGCRLQVAGCRLQVVGKLGAFASLEPAPAKAGVTILKIWPDYFSGV
jgi:hypothetical protein